MSLRHTLLLVCVACAAIAERSPGQTVIRTLTGSSGQGLGGSIVDAGDFNADGWGDYLVGTPFASGSRGGVVCVSGKYLATGAAPATLYTFTMFAPFPSEHFGWTIAPVGDVDGDGKVDFIVGAPYYTSGTFGSCGSIRAFHSADQTIGPPRVFTPTDNSHASYSMSAAGDVDGDGYIDVIVGAPGASGEAFVASGRYVLNGTGAGVLATFVAPQATARWGHAVLGGVDLNGDGARDFAVSASQAEQAGHTDQGLLRVISGAPGFPQLGDYWGQDAQQLGRALAGGEDFDGDAHLDLVVSTFNSDASSTIGKVIALSVYDLANNTPPFEIFSANGPSQLLGTASFGAALAIAPDLNGDGVDEVLVGLPTSNATLTGPTGGVRVLSGATGALIGSKAGAQDECLGSALFGCTADFDADGYPDFLVGGRDCDVPSTNCGVIKALRLFPSPPARYCTGKVNSLGCTPSMGWTGSASATSAAAFPVRATNVINNKNGLLFYGYQPVAVAFQGGHKCVGAPTLRTLIQSSGGSAGGNDCSGTFSFDFNAHIQSGLDPQLVAGAEVFCQYWSRDPASPSTTSLTDALNFLVNP